MGGGLTDLGARLRSVHHISLEPHGRTISLEHPMEAVYYMMDGGGAAS